MDKKFNEFTSKDSLEVNLAKAVCSALEAVIDRKGSAVIAVSGGKTPLGLFKKLSIADIAWNKVKVVLVDERLVATKDSDRNDLMVKQSLMVNKAKSATYIDLTAYKQHQDFFDSLTLDVAILGMGLDGHTASWFPCSDEINGLFDMKSAVAIVNPVTAPHKRVTLTPAVLLKSNALFLHIVGQDKLSVYREAVKNADSKLMPISFLLSQEYVDINTYWSP